MAFKKSVLSLAEKTVKKQAHYYFLQETTLPL
jgi:hypothetical protein